MKWSELFASILGDKDIEVTQSTESNQSTQNNSPVSTESEDATTTEQLRKSKPTEQLNSSTNHTTAPNLTQEQFDALNARIKELESANRELALKGTVDTPPAKSPEEIIYDLCVGRSNNGKNSNTNTSERTNR